MTPSITRHDRPSIIDSSTEHSNPHVFKLIMNDNQSLVRTLPDDDDHSRSLNDLQNQDIHALVSTFVQSNPGQPLVKAVISLLHAIPTKADLQRLINRLLSTLTGRQFYNVLFNALKAHVKAHPWSTAFFIIGIILLCNPLAMAGFGSLGPVAGSLAAGWQSSMGGTVAAGSAFAILQSWGMMYSIAIPVAGTIITAGSVAAATVGKQVKRMFGLLETPVDERLRDGAEESTVTLLPTGGMADTRMR